MASNPPHPGNFLREWRLHGTPNGKRLTLEHLANILGISTSLLSERERGMKPVDMEHLNKMAEICGCEPWMLLMAPPNSPELAAMKRAHENLKSMNAKQQEAWLLLGEQIIES